MHILVIDNDPAAREWLTTLLSNARYDVGAATDVPSAIMSVAHLSARPDLILFDVSTAEDESERSLFRDEQHALLAGIPVVLLGSNQTVYTRSIGIQAFEFLQKPLEADAVLDVAARYCQLS